LGKCQQQHRLVAFLRKHSLGHCCKLLGVSQVYMPFLGQRVGQPGELHAQGSEGCAKVKATATVSPGSGGSVAPVSFFFDLLCVGELLCNVGLLQTEGDDSKLQYPSATSCAEQFFVHFSE
jgi:hypothetical protein